MWIQDLARVSRREEKTRPGLPCVLPLARAHCRSGQVGADAGWGLLDDMGKLQREAEAARESNFGGLFVLSRDLG